MSGQNWDVLHLKRFDIDIIIIVTQYIYDTEGDSLLTAALALRL